MTYKISILILTMSLLATSLLAGGEEQNLDERCSKKYQQFQDHTMCLQRSSQARTVNMSDEWKQRILDYHNLKRSTVQPTATNMMKVRWDDEMELMALRWAEACEFRHALEHDYQRFIPGSMFIGQSMSSTTIDFDLAMQFWFKEGETYRYGVDYEQQSYEFGCGFSVGHYTQMVWAETYLVGCAATTCENKFNVIVCNYGPSGNMLPFENPYEKGPQCSKCKNCTEDGLCDCGDLNCHGGTLDPSTCTCDCTIEADGYAPDFLQLPDCSLNCTGKDFSYCGYEPFDNCKDSWTAKKCPHLCKVCPYSEKTYVPEGTTNADTSSDADGTSYNSDGTYGYGVGGTNGTLAANGTLGVNDTLNVNGTDLLDEMYSGDGTQTVSNILS